MSPEASLTGPSPDPHRCLTVDNKVIQRVATVWVRGGSRVATGRAWRVLLATANTDSPSRRETTQPSCLPGIRGALAGLWLPARRVLQACCLGGGPAVVRQGSEVDREMPFVCRGFLLLFASGGFWAARVE